MSLNLHEKSALLSSVEGSLLPSAKIGLDVVHNLNKVGNETNIASELSDSSLSKPQSDKNNDNFPESFLRAKPFLRWAGGKQLYLDDLISHLEIPRSDVYHEPFLGGGSVALSLPFKRAFLSDSNAELINCFDYVRSDPVGISTRLGRFGKTISSEVYYQVRSRFNRLRGSNTINQAVRFILLNRTSFNGIYRVNKNGSYNVPFGKPTPFIPSAEMFERASLKLSTAFLTEQDFCASGERIERDHLVYLDPPYPKISKTAYFSHYSTERFPDDMQESVADFANKCRKKGASVVISNADTPEIRNLYKDWNIFRLEKCRFLSCKQERLRVFELIIRSY